MQFIIVSDQFPLINHSLHYFDLTLFNNNKPFLNLAKNDIKWFTTSPNTLVGNIFLQHHISEKSEININFICNFTNEIVYYTLEHDIIYD